VCSEQVVVQSADAIKPDQVPAHVVAAVVGVARAWASAVALAEVVALEVASVVMGLVAAQMYPAQEVGPPGAMPYAREPRVLEMLVAMKRGGFMGPTYVLWRTNSLATRWSAGRTATWRPPWRPRRPAT
jgi:hypothetical protein